jgi:hypothetical protein
MRKSPSLRLAGSTMRWVKTLIVFVAEKTSLCEPFARQERRAVGEYTAEYYRDSSGTEEGWPLCV